MKYTCTQKFTTHKETFSVVFKRITLSCVLKVRVCYSKFENDDFISDDTTKNL